MPPPSFPPPRIHVTAITVSSIPTKRPKHLISGEVCTGPDRLTLDVGNENGTLGKEFPSIVELSPDTQIILHYRTSLRLKRKARIGIRHFFTSFSADRMQDLSVTQDGIQVVFSCQTPNTIHSIIDDVHPTAHPRRTLTLFPITQAILDDCPQLRILVIGKSGVGKSSLIKTAFGIDDAHASDFARGDADIQRGLKSDANERFILHDSLGFEPGDEEKYNTVKDFIQSKRIGPLKDQLHAIWFCVPVPRAGSRLLEAAAEDFFTTKNKIMGSIPIIVVYTKLDLFVDERTMGLAPSHPEFSEENLTKLAFSEAESGVRTCHSEIDKRAGESLPYAVISTKEEYKHTFERLVQLTYNTVGMNSSTPVARIASVVTLMAQRVVPDLNIQGTIDIGKQRYWTALKTGSEFEGHTIWDCLSVIHVDIVTVWNFNDPARHLLHDNFKELVIDMIPELEMSPLTKPNRVLTLRAGSLMAAVSAFLASVPNPAAPIVLPMSTGKATAVRPSDVYQNTKNVKQLFITYIVDLTHIMETLFILTSRHHKSLTRRAIKLAYSIYHNSSVKKRAHNGIQKCHDLDGRDASLVIESLIKPERSGESSLKDYYAEIGKLDLGKHNLDQEEEW